MASCYKNAITNSLFLTHAAQLALQYRALGQPGKAAWAASWASKQLGWLLGSGMINGSWLVNDGLDTFGTHPEVCLNNRRTAYTYNQGVVLSGLAYTGVLSNSTQQLALAARIVQAVFGSSLVHAGTHILREMAEPAQLPLPNLYSVSGHGWAAV